MFFAFFAQAPVEEGGELEKEVRGKHLIVLLREKAGKKAISRGNRKNKEKIRILFFKLINDMGVFRNNKRIFFE